MQCSPIWTPSISSATRSSASSAVDRQAASCAAVFATNRRLTALLLVPRLTIGAGNGSRLRRILPRRHADEHLLDHATIQRILAGHRLKCRQRHFVAVRPHARPTNRHLAAAEHDLAGTVPARDAVPLHLMLISRAADRRPIRFEHRREGPSGQRRRRVPSARRGYRRGDRRVADGAGWVNRLGPTDRLCETLVSWRLLVGGLSPGASHHSFTTSSEEPPLSNFNSYWDIPSAPLGMLAKRFDPLVVTPLGNGRFARAAGFVGLRNSIGGKAPSHRVCRSRSRRRITFLPAARSTATAHSEEGSC